MEPVKKYNRWPVKHRDISYGDRLALLVGIIKSQENDPNNMGNNFLHSRIYYIRAALEEKFNRHFSLVEIKRIINDKSWQTQGTPSQAFDKQEGTVPFSNATTINNLKGEPSWNSHPEPLSNPLVAT